MSYAEASIKGAAQPATDDPIPIDNVNIVKEEVEEAVKAVAEATEEAVQEGIKSAESATAGVLPELSEVPAKDDGSSPKKTSCSCGGGVPKALSDLAASVHAAIVSAAAAVKNNPTTATYVASAVAATSVLALGFANTHKFGPHTTFGAREASVVAASLVAVGAGHYIVINTSKKPSK